MVKSPAREAICVSVVRALRAERLRQGLSMDRLAERAGLSQGMISLVEHDLRNPTLDTLLRMSEALEMDLWRALKKASIESEKPSRSTGEC